MGCGASFHMRSGPHCYFWSRARPEIAPSLRPFSCPPPVLVVVYPSRPERRRLSLQRTGMIAMIHRLRGQIPALGGKESLGREAELSIFPTKILLATDGSEEAELARTTAVDEANSTNSELHVVIVGPWMPDPAYAIGEASFRWQTYEQASEEIRKEAREILDDQVRKIEEEGASVQEAYLRRGRLDQEIVRLAEEIGAGLIVIGSRGRGGVRRALMGSVSDSVVRHAHCPVLVVRIQKQQAAL